MEKRKATIYELAKLVKNVHCHCSSCPLDKYCSEYSSLLCEMDFDWDELNDAVAKWNDEHPIKTYKQDFLEKFPNAKQCHPGRPALCRGDIYGNRIQVCDTHRANCTACWNEEMPDD